MSAGGARVLFIDRDGTLIEEPPDEQVDRLDKVRLLPGVIPALLRLREAGYRFVMVSNQDGLGTDSFPAAAFEGPQAFLLDLLATQGIHFDEVFICPHFPQDGCHCRKPATGLLTRYLAATDLDMAHSAVIGDRDTDMQLAANVGLTGLRVVPPASPRPPVAHAGTSSAGNGAAADTGDWHAIAARLAGTRRSGTTRRTTRETDIHVAVDLDTPGYTQIRTGIGFLDHMLEQLARHGGFSLTLVCDGDLHIDEHHSLEDVALTLGQCLRNALGPKVGIARYGFLLPMDEASATVALDLSGRPLCRFDAPLRRERIGELPTELVGHFFESLAQTLGATLHVTVTGENEHHMVEAAFKGVGRALRQAVKVEDRGVPSTKGVL